MFVALTGYPFTAGISTWSAAAANATSTQLVNALDPIGGGTYTNTTAQIILDGNKGFKFDYDSGPGLEISGVIGASVLNGSLLTVDLGGTIVFTSGSMLDGSTIATLTLENTSILTAASGAIVTLATGSNILFDAGSATTFDGDVDLGGAMVISSGGAIGVASGGEIFLDNGGLFTVQSGGDIVVENGGEVTVSSGATHAIASGGTLTLGGTVTPTHAARTFTRTACHVANFDGSKWSETVVPNVGYYTSNSIAAASTDVITFAIDPPDGCTITGVSVWTDPPGAHAGEPGVKTTVRLYEQNVVTGAAITQVFTQEDPATVAGGTYEPAHAITKTGLTTVVDKTTKTYFVVVVPESGANAIVGTKIWPPTFTFTRTKLGEE